MRSFGHIATLIVAIGVAIAAPLAVILGISAGEVGRKTIARSLFAQGGDLAREVAINGQSVLHGPTPSADGNRSSIFWVHPPAPTR